MKKWIIPIFVLLLLIAVAVGSYLIDAPTSLREIFIRNEYVKYELILETEIDGIRRRESQIVCMCYEFMPRHYEYEPHIGGVGLMMTSAPRYTLHPGQEIYVLNEPTLPIEPSYKNKLYIGHSLKDLPWQLIGQKSDNPDGTSRFTDKIRRLERVSEITRIDLASLPMIGWFSRYHDAESMVEVHPWEFERIFGSGVKLLGAYVHMLKGAACQRKQLPAWLEENRFLSYSVEVNGDRDKYSVHSLSLKGK